MMRSLTPDEVRRIAENQERDWERDAAAGLFDPNDAQREWSAADDQEVCAVCRSLAHQQVPFLESFVDCNGRRLRHPPACDTCRCVVNLVL